MRYKQLRTDSEDAANIVQDVVKHFIEKEGTVKEIKISRWYFCCATW